MKQSTIGEAKSITLTKENIKNYPKQVQEAFALMESMDRTAYLTPKYYESLKLLKSSKLVSMFKENPNHPLKDVVATIIGELPEFIPADKILELTAFTLEKWQELAKTNEEVAL